MSLRDLIFSQSSAEEDDKPSNAVGVGVGVGIAQQYIDEDSDNSEIVEDAMITTKKIKW